MRCGNGWVESQRDSAAKAQGWEERATLGKSPDRITTPTGLRIITRDGLKRKWRNPVGVDDCRRDEPRVARCSRPWALWSEPRWGSFRWSATSRLRKAVTSHRTPYGGSSAGFRRFSGDFRRFRFFCPPTLGGTQFRAPDHLFANHLFATFDPSIFLPILQPAVARSGPSFVPPVCNRRHEFRIDCAN